jgi:two-component system LytT family response regulator
MKFRALLVDDEPVALRALRDLLTEIPWIEVVGNAADGLAALDAIARDKPDLVFLDVQMPGASGIDVLERAGADLAVIFTTAHDDYAMTAFELGAIDYLRKPFGKARFVRAVERARPHLEAARQRRDASAGSPLAERLAFAREPARPISRLFVRDRGAVIPVRAMDVVRCEADGDYVAVHARGRRHLVYVNLGDLEAQLDPERFVRVHRSHLVNLDFVASLEPHDANRLEVRLKDGLRVVASRAGTQLLRARIT